MRRIATIAAAAVLALALAGCASSAPSSSSAPSASSESSALSASEPTVSSSSSASAQSTAAINWTKVKSAEEAAKGAKIDKFGVMDQIIANDTEFKDPAFAYADGVAQALYETGAMAIDVRKADGSHKTPLSDRDKTEFAQTWSKSYEDLDVTLYGPATGAATVFSWADGTQQYCVTFQGLGGEEVTMDSDDVAMIVKGMKEANAKTEQKAEEKSEEAKTTEQFIVPNVIGMSADDAAAAIEAAGLSPDGNNVGTVVSQAPEAGTELDAGDTVSIQTDGGNTCIVPDVVGMEVPDAVAAIGAAGLSPDGNNSGTVIAQSPEPGAVLDPGDTVSIKTDEEENVEGCIVPNVVGMDAASAGAAIEAAGLSPDGNNSGIVVGQAPEPGTVLDFGDTVSIKTDE